MAELWHCGIKPSLHRCAAAKIHFEVPLAYLLPASEVQQLDQWVWQVPAPLRLGLWVTEQDREEKERTIMSKNYFATTDYNKKNGCLNRNEHSSINTARVLLQIQTQHICWDDIINSHTTAAHNKQQIPTDFGHNVHICTIYSWIPPWDMFPSLQKVENIWERQMKQGLKLTFSGDHQLTGQSQWSHRVLVHQSRKTTYTHKVNSLVNWITLISDEMLIYKTHVTTRAINSPK